MTERVVRAGQPVGRVVASEATALPREIFDLKALGHPIIPAPITYPITLSARSPFVDGVAALVFVSPNVVDPSQDHAEFGVRIRHPEAEIDDRYETQSAHPDARVVAWFRSTDPDRDYLIQFTGMAVGNFTLVDGEGGSEVVAPDPGQLDRWQAWGFTVSRSFHGSSEWHWFSLSNPVWWTLTGCLIHQL
jgi:hypothetical protein